MWTCGRTLMDSRIQKLVKTNILLTGMSLFQLFCKFRDFYRRVSTQQFVQFSYAPLTRTAASGSIRRSVSGINLCCTLQCNIHHCRLQNHPVSFLHRRHVTLLCFNQSFSVSNFYSTTIFISIPLCKTHVESFTFDFLKAMTTRLLQTQHSVFREMEI